MKLSVTRLNNGEYTTVEKSWGHELWIENNDEYCGKELHFYTSGIGTSMHFHVLKRETMYCMLGGFSIVYIDTDTAAESAVSLFPGDSVEIPRFVPHKIIPLNDNSILIEFSTKHFEEDSYRVSK